MIAVATLDEVIAILEEANRIEERCDFSDLLKDQCAHCKGHVADWELEPKRPEVYDGA